LTSEANQPRVLTASQVFVSKSLTPQRVPLLLIHRSTAKPKEVTINLHKTKSLIAIGIAVLAVVSAVAFTKSNRINPPILSKDKQEKRQTVDTLPLIISQVTGIEVVKATLKNPGTANPIAVLEIKNNSNKPVIAVSVEIGEPEEADGITANGFNEGDESPDVVIEPHGFITLELPLNNAKPGDPIRVSGVVYADDSEDGEKTALETIHAQREHTKSEKRKSERRKVDSSPKEKGGSSPR
jgi:hypothetical protein